jgi:hypothetical protein
VNPPPLDVEVLATPSARQKVVLNKTAISNLSILEGPLFATLRLKIVHFHFSEWVTL